MKTAQDLKQDEVELHKGHARKYADIREKNAHYIYFNDLWVKLIEKMIPKGTYEKTLDLGCGTVEFYELIHDRLKSSYSGIDLSPEMIEEGRQKYGNIDVQAGDAEDLPYKDRSFDLVVSRGLLHHLPDPVKGTKEAARVLKDGGYFIVSEPHSNMILYLVRKLFYKSSSHFSDSHKSFPRSEFIEVVEKGGFTVERVEYWGILSFPFGFPDILPLYKFMPLPIFKILVQIDQVLTKIPFINSFSWHMIVLGRKK